MNQPVPIIKGDAANPSKPTASTPARLDVAIQPAIGNAAQSNAPTDNIATQNEVHAVAHIANGTSAKPPNPDSRIANNGSIKKPNARTINVLSKTTDHAVRTSHRRCILSKPPPKLTDGIIQRAKPAALPATPNCKIDRTAARPRSKSNLNA